MPNSSTSGTVNTSSGKNGKTHKSHANKDTSWKYIQIDKLTRIQYKGDKNYMKKFDKYISELQKSGKSSKSSSKSKNTNSSSKNSSKNSSSKNKKTTKTTYTTSTTDEIYDTAPTASLPQINTKPAYSTIKLQTENEINFGTGYVLDTTTEPKSNVDPILVEKEKKEKKKKEPDPTFGYTSTGPVRKDGTPYKKRLDDIDEKTLSNAINHMNQTLFLTSTGSVRGSLDRTLVYYNRFKIPDPDLYTHKYVPYIFFVRPSCNIFKSDGTLQPSLSDMSNEVFNYAYKFCPELLRELDGSVHNQGSDFMYSLSNAVSKFETSDEYIKNNTYGRNYSGYNIAYGKNDIESKTSGEIDFEFKETKDLHIYLLHRLWVEYISGCYRGTILPRDTSILNKVLDYTASVYYIVTAEDAETILFWTKYYGIFPTIMPSSQFAWGEGNLITGSSVDKISIKYCFSFKSDYDPYILYREFNHNAHVDYDVPKTHAAIYDPDLGQLGDNLVRTPFIEKVEDAANGRRFLLRFTQEKINTSKDFDYDITQYHKQTRTVTKHTTTVTTANSKSSKGKGKTNSSVSAKAKSKKDKKSKKTGAKKGKK